jgi:hypothetical protein
MDLHHYEAIGTMTHALDYHAEKAYGELSDDQQEAICERVFQAITDKGTDARGIRRPTSAATLNAITGASLDELTSVLAVFRKPSRSFVMPPAAESVAPETVIDISHESLMRVWNRLKAWVEEEAESASQYQRLVENAALHAKGAAGLMTDPELSLMLDWQQKRQPNAAWGNRYRPGFDSAIGFLDESRRARDAAVEAEKERQRRELRRTRIVAGVMGAAFLLSVGFGGYALYQQRRAAAEERRATDEQRRSATEKAAREEAEKAAEIQRQLTNKADEARQMAEFEKARAETADAHAESQRNMVLNAVDAGTRAVVAENSQLDLQERIQLDTEAKKDAATLDREKQALDVASKTTHDLRLDAGSKAAEAAGLIGNGKVISPRQVSGSDLFDVSNGTVLTNWSGRSTAGGADPKPDRCGGISSVTQNPMDMFSGSSGSPCRATVFFDGQVVGTEHWIEWKTPKVVTVSSVGLFAAHDSIRLRRSFSRFKFYVKKQGQWKVIKEYIPRINPALAYGGGCGSESCPPPAQGYPNGNVLAVCVNIPPTTGDEFRAGFVQWASSAERFSGPRLLQLDGYATSNCSK